jgi:hypothetical protein
MACPYVDLIELPRRPGPAYVCRAPVRQGTQVPLSAGAFRSWCLGEGFPGCPRYERVIARDGEEIGLEGESAPIVPAPGDATGARSS